ncbi:Phage late control gene D protein (GPD) [Pseudovibrio axinellae]|uniref:Phage late control gene D protein (GPD) n=1 Tax=Pseudovibrio axinellae TaxID=989403 RepID=A0A165XHG8_9HYPH|nr:contractile injection system protein, VgrG/Pvc8 family [Pseudovibrio axinellae]KZL17703.1 Phage late control gene D protein (GPD) [Pseudovibrio axinellae]SER42993.1 Phage protein D [Pseudovibrio axinellae]
MTPFFEVWSEGEDISGRMRAYGIECSITENAGGNSDTVTFTITDPNAEIEPPEKGTEFNLVAGFKDSASGERFGRDFGKFKVDQIRPTGYPHAIFISAQSLDAGSSVKEKQTRAYKSKDYPTFRDIFDEIARRNDWTLKISDDVGNEKNRYQAQSEEDDTEFASRLGAKFDASVSIKDRNLVVMKKGTGKTISGREIEPYLIEPGFNLLADNGYSVEDLQRPKYGTVKAKWYDRAKAEQEIEEEEVVEDGPTFEIPEVFPSQEEAQTAAKSKATALARATGKATFNTRGDIWVQAGCFVLSRNIRPEADGLWSSTSITHHFKGDSYYYTTFQCEVPTVGRTEAAKAAQAGEVIPDPKARLSSPYAPNPNNIGLNEGDGPE